MKAFRPYLLILALLPLFLSCSKEETSPVLTGIEASSLDPLPFSSVALTMPEAGTNPIFFTATWTETQFFLDNDPRPAPVGPVKYTLEVDVAGSNFTNAYQIASTESLAAHVYVKELNNILVGTFVLTPDFGKAIEFRVVASYGLNQPSLFAVSKNKQTINLTPYTPPSDIEAVYMIGNPNGWDNSGREFIMYRNDNEPNNLIYTYTGYFGDSGDGGCYFKFASESNLGSWSTLYCMGAGGTIVFGDFDAFKVDVGYHTVTLDLSAMTYTIVPFDASAKPVYSAMGLIGAFCGWENEPEMLQSSYDEHKWTLNYSFDDGTELKFRANFSWDENWGGDGFPYGLGVGGGNNIVVPAGNYTFYFNDLTGHYAIIRK